MTRVGAFWDVGADIGAAEVAIPLLLWGLTKHQYIECLDDMQLARPTEPIIRR